MYNLYVLGGAVVLYFVINCILANTKEIIKEY